MEAASVVLGETGYPTLMRIASAYNIVGNMFNTTEIDLLWQQLQ